VVARKNVLIILMSVELMLNGVNVAFVAAARTWATPPEGLRLHVMTVAAAEAAVGLALLIALYRLKETIDITELKVSNGERHPRLPVAGPGAPAARGRAQRRDRPVRRAAASSEEAGLPLAGAMVTTSSTGGHGDSSTDLRPVGLRPRHPLALGLAWDHHEAPAYGTWSPSSPRRWSAPPSSWPPVRPVARLPTRDGRTFVQILFPWIQAGSLLVPAGLQLDRSPR